jgi:hypothetical protein
MNFDPNTGQPIQQPQQNFDPNTGQPYVQQPQQPMAPAPQPAPYAPMQPAPQAPMQPVPQAPMQPGPRPQQPMGAPYTPPVKKDETLAWVSAALAGAAWFLGLNLLTAIPAVIVGHMAKKKIKKDPDKYGGDTIATVGLVGGWIMIGLGIIGLIIGVFAILLQVCAGCAAFGLAAVNS